MKGRVSPRPALRVAAAATITVGMIYVLLVAVMLTLVSNRLIHETDTRLAEQVGDAQQLSAADLQARSSAGRDTDDAPVYFWRVTAAGAVDATTAGAPVFPAGLLRGRNTFPRTVFVAGRDFRFAKLTLPGGSRLFAAESLIQEHHVRAIVLTAALLVSPVLLAGVFIGALVIGRQASKPVERARRRQLEFTSDASHELRTPLTVIQAEVGLALSSNRPAGGYRDALQRIAGESGRLRRIVEDLLWLARFDSEPPPPQTELVDVTTIARGCADRFEPILQTRDIHLDVEVTGEDAAQIAAAPEWVDRLVGVLLDNAIRYARSGGRVVVQVDATPGQVALTVADDGPGIPAPERARLFDRFHRIDETTGEGAGLGLAIADTVVRSTHGRWTVGDSALGGASMTVTWAAPRVRTASRFSPVRL